MKLTRGALSFLLAEYRSIFKKAYIKGLASAVVLTAGLAAGQANAENLSSSSDLTDVGEIQITGSDSASGSGTYQFVTVSQSETLNTSGHDVIITSGSAASTGGNYVSGNGSPASWSGTNLEIRIESEGEVDYSGSGLLIGSSGTLTMETITVNAGALVLSGGSSTAAASVSGGTIEINGDDAYLIFSGSAADSVIAGTLNFTSGGNLLVEDNSSGAISVEGGEWDVNASIQGNLELSISKTSGDSTENIGRVDITSGTVDISGGSLIISSGTLAISDGVDLKASDESSTIKVDGNTENFAGSVTESVNSTLEISDSTLQTFLNVSGDESQSGSLLLVSGGVLKFTDSADLADYAWSGGETASDGVIVVSGSLVTGDELKISNTLSNSNNAALSSDANLYVEAGKLTLGSGSYTGTSTLGFKQATAKSNLVVNASGSFVLADTVVLETDEAADPGIVTSETGSILKIGTSTASGSLSFTQGVWDVEVNVDLVSGSITIGSDSSVTQAGDVAVVFGEDTRLNLGSASGDDSSSITIAASSSGNASLDLTAAKVTWQDTSNDSSKNVNITVKGDSASSTYGYLYLTGVQMGDFFGQDSGNNVSGTTLLIGDNGVVNVSGSVSGSVDFSQFSGSQNSGVGIVAMEDGARLEIEGSLSLVTSSEDSSLDLGNSGATLAVQTLEINDNSNNSDGATTVTIENGIIEVSEGISSDNDTLIISGDSGPASWSGSSLTINPES